MQFFGGSTSSQLTGWFLNVDDNMRFVFWNTPNYGYVNTMTSVLEEIHSILVKIPKAKIESISVEANGSNQLYYVMQVFIKIGLIKFRINLTILTDRNGDDVTIDNFIAISKPGTKDAFRARIDSVNGIRRAVKSVVVHHAEMHQRAMQKASSKYQDAIAITLKL